jgi:2'-5' RNA ligase
MPTSNPRMIWIKYHIHPAFTELNHALHHVLKKFLLKTHPIYPNPLPHITLARFYGFKKEININEFKNVLLQPLTVKEIRMWETMPSESKSDYSVSEKPFFLRNN